MMDKMLESVVPRETYVSVTQRTFQQTYRYTIKLNKTPTSTHKQHSKRFSWIMCW
jgi:hypothetical protein